MVSLEEISMTQMYGMWTLICQMCFFFPPIKNVDGKLLAFTFYRKEYTFTVLFQGYFNSFALCSVCIDLNSEYPSNMTSDPLY